MIDGCKIGDCDIDGCESCKYYQPNNIKIGMVVKLEHLDADYSPLTGGSNGIKEGLVGVVLDTTEDGNLDIYFPSLDDSFAWIYPKDINIISDPLAEYR